MACLRLLGTLHGYLPADPFEAWAANAVVDYCTDYVDLYKPHHKGPHTDETKQDYFDRIGKFAAHFDAQLQKQGSKFITGNKMTIGDFTVSWILFNFVYNDALGGGADYYTQGGEIVAQHTALSKYVETMREELKEYLENRSPAPL